MTAIEDRGSKIETALERINSVVRRIIGAPDYSAYLRYQSARHPECKLLTEREFLDEQLTARYSKPGSRCC